MAATDSAAVKVRPSISFMDVLPVIFPIMPLLAAR